MRQLAQQRLGLHGQDDALIEATFHPEYGYGDFVAKLLPQSRIQQQEFELSQEPDKGWNGLRLREVHDGARIEYRIHAGPLLRRWRAPIPATVRCCSPSTKSTGATAPRSSATCSSCSTATRKAGPSMRST